MRRPLKVDVLLLASGAVIAVLGALVLFDSTDEIDLSLGWVAVALTAAVGLILVVSGLADSPRRRDD
jgi:peptidoglycan/LPS O-acetylase OafA/YrhL